MSGAPLITSDEIAARLDRVRNRIADCGADPDSVTIVGVTKTFPAELARRAVVAGLTELGENYGQELQAKAAALATDPPPGPPGCPNWHFIGGLQRNKIKPLAPVVSLWQTVDRQPLVAELAKRAPGAKILIQVNTTDEDQKSGCHPSQVEELTAEARSLGIDVAGLMTIGPTDGSAPDRCFELLASLGAELDLKHLSMGMSGDYDRAVVAGATMIRLGSVLFGPRSG